MRLKKSVAVIMFLIFFLWTSGCAYKGRHAATENFFAMDAPCTVTFYGADAFPDVKECILSLDRKLSSHNDKSDIFRLNKEKSAVLDKDEKSILEQSAELYEKYGVVDITIGEITKLWDILGESPAIPSDEAVSLALETVGCHNISFSGNKCVLKNGASIDLGAVGKGFALDRVYEILKEKDISCAVVSFGSSSLLYGRKPDESSFKIAVKDPEDDSKTLLNFEIDNGFVSTSGGYERFFEADGKKYCHIFDKTTGRPTETDLTTVTVICESGIKSDFLSTCIFIDGSENIGKYLDNEDFQVIAADKNKNIYCSEKIEGKIKLKDSSYKLI